MKKVKNNSTSGLSDEQMLYQLEGRPRLSIAFPMGLQHVLAMFAGNLAPMLIIAANAGGNGDHDSSGDVDLWSGNTFAIISDQDRPFPNWFRVAICHGD